MTEAEFTNKMGRQRKVIEKQIKGLIKELNLDVIFDDVKEMIWNEETLEDYQRFVGMFVEKIADIKRANEVCQIVSDAWNNLPHKSLGGLSPLEMVERSKKPKD